MIEALGIPREAILLIPLALAAGIDLHLTIVLLGLAGLIDWEAPLPPALHHLQSLPVVLVSGALFLAEVVAERFPRASLLWHAIQNMVRPFAGALLALVLLDPLSPAAKAGGAAAGALLAWLGHALKWGANLRHWTTRPRGLTLSLRSLAEDTTVATLVVLSLDLPLIGAGVALSIALLAPTLAPKFLRTTRRALRLVWSMIRDLLEPDRWDRSDDISWPEIRKGLLG